MNSIENEPDTAHKDETEMKSLSILNETTKRALVDKNFELSKLDEL